ncbi:hypothetical protein FOCC_FOCC017374, partial [Frankliniella occidentalis]
MAQVPKFDLLKPEAWEDFLEDFELYCDGKGVTDGAQKRGMLCGAIPAETLAKLKDRELSTPRIKPTVNPLARFDDFVMRMQNPSETAQTYVSELGKLGKALDLGDLHDRLVLAQLVRGLRNRELQKELFSLADTLNLTVAMRKAELVETGEKCLERIENNRMGEVFTLKAGPSAGSENKGRGRRSDPPSCYRCAGPHFVADCKIDPRTLRCEICKRVGHSTKAHIGDRAPRTRRGKGKPEGLHRVEGHKSEEEQSEGEDVGEGLYHVSFEDDTETPTVPPPTPPAPPVPEPEQGPEEPLNLSREGASGARGATPLNLAVFSAHLQQSQQQSEKEPAEPRCPPLLTKYLAAIEKNVQRGVWVPVDVNESGVPKWATALVPVPKKGGALRLCADYKGTVNRAVAADTYLTPTIDEVLAACQGGKFFGELDLAEAYTQVPLDMETSLALTVNSCKGLFRPTTLPFGVKIATAIFQRIMDGLFGGKDGIIPYLDNIYVVGADWKQYVGRLHQALTILSEAGFLVNAEKCTWGEQALDVLGFRVGQGGVMPQEVKVRAIKDAPAPANKQQLSSLLGLIAFYGRFIKNKASILEPLHRLLDDGKDFHWGEQEQAALDAVKRQVAAEPCLAHFDPKRAIFLSADASPWGVGALIAHEFKDKETGKVVERPIAFASRTLSKAERNYAQVDREALAIIFGVKRFKMFLQGRPFTIRTDHQPLTFLFKAGAPSLEHISPRMLRWTLLLGSMDYKIEYRAGKDMGSADFLSRHPLPDIEEESYVPGVHLLEAKDWSGITSTQIAEESAKDPTLRQVLRWTRDGWPKTVSDNFLPFYRKREALSILKGCLLWSDRVVIPPSLREDTLKLTHASHSGINFSKSTARAVAWWPNMDDEVELRVKRCAPCQSTANRPPRDLTSTWPAARQVWERVHVDFAGPFEGHLYLITIDAFSKWPVIKVVANLTAECLITHMRYIFAEYGLPGLIVSDNGRQLVSKDFETFLRRNGVRHITSPPWHPSSNGLAERTVQSFKKLLRRFTEGDVHARVARALWAMRTRPSTTTGKSPAALLGRPLNGHLERLRPTDHPDGGAHKDNPWLGRQVWALRHKLNAKSEWISGLVTGVEGARVVVVEDIATREQLRVSVDEVRDRPDGAPAPALPESQAGDATLEKDDDDVTP